ncbi:MAG: hypothetical protein MUF70_04210 [Myxococcota bacterium]|nr:hypothetical protein [Myxococcota bacterium]
MQDRPRIRRKRRLAALALVAAIGIAWAIPGPVPALIARQETLLLGRYGVAHFTALALATLVLGLAAVLSIGRRSLAENARLAALAIAATAAGVVAIAGVAQELVAPRYVATPVARAVADPELRERLTGRVLTRQPGLRWEVSREDRPAPGRSYARRSDGQPSRQIVLSTDDRGLRNPPRAGRYDVVVTGDSFTEGSMVSDDETWWRRLSERTGLRVYNTAVSGLSLREYLNNWAAFGLDAGAATLVVLVYEGNDWKPLAKPRAAAQEPHSGDASALRARAQQALIQWLAPIGAGWPPPAHVGLDWMPPRVAGHAYAFEPKHLMRLDWDPAAFRAAPEWTSNEAVLAELAAVTRARGVRLVVAYAPVKPHVILPLLGPEVSDEALRAFAAFRDHARPLPPVDGFRQHLLERLDVQESTLRDWCAAREIAFVSTTEVLRAAVARGVPAYFTYDPHWTEAGHAVAAERIATALGL